MMLTTCSTSEQLRLAFVPRSSRLRAPLPCSQLRTLPRQLYGETSNSKLRFSRISNRPNSRKWRLENCCSPKAYEAKDKPIYPEDEFLSSFHNFDPNREVEPQPKRRGLPKTIPEERPIPEPIPINPDPAPVEIPSRPEPGELPTTIPREGDDPDLYDRDRLMKRLRQGSEYAELSRENMTDVNVTSSNLTQVLLELEAIMEGDPRNIVILGTRHCNLLHQRIIELVSYALVLTGNHIYTSGGMGTNFVAIRGALRAENETQSRLSVILPQTIKDQPLEVQEVLEKVTNVTELKRNDIPLDKASRLCNSELLDQASELIVFAYHDSWTVLDCAAEARRKDKLVTLMYLD
eukprot:CAMPEP_0184498626 /NCGR_PEP_ID=MMETSP0113_2-20130426/39436_1 /TAXON_ID=91329 /ORGANISM="Norrisiella sphaerica, Strain BC52" /LENGTH=348 /DNA_ID=CAMNT_0026886227 /DNA_START=722 /DNA_END=1768 /DNA_ORIENTATION=+